MAANFAVNQRIEYDNFRGTVKWIGEIQNINGTWLGIDWDDENRGKHNGIYQDIVYFQARCPHSGSFIKPQKVNSGISLEKAVRTRYQDDYNIAEMVTSQLQRQIKARFVEVVGMEKISKKQSQLENLKTVVLDGMLVKSGGDTDLKSLLPNVQHLDVSNTLLSNWKDVADITCQLPNLRVLNISNNSILISRDLDSLIEKTCHIDNQLIMNKMLEYDWAKIISCLHLFPQLTNLQVAANRLTKLGEISEGHLSFLKELDLGLNPIEDWNEICQLSTLPNLESLNLSGCKLREIKFEDTRPGCETDTFSTLKSLAIAGNPLNWWDSVSELTKLRKLERLIVSNDIIEENNFIEFTFARMLHLMTLNRTTITSREKRQHQLFYLKKFADDFFDNSGEDFQTDQPNAFLQKHPTFLKICEKVNPMLVDERSLRPATQNRSSNSKIDVSFVLENQTLRHSFNLNVKISRVKMILRRIFKLDMKTKFSLSYYPDKDDTNFVIDLDDEVKDLNFYSVSDDAVIKLKLK